jgi:YD repeat-containing protein
MNLNNDGVDYNELAMRILVYGFVAIMVVCFLMFTFNAIAVGPKNDAVENVENFDNKQSADQNSDQSLAKTKNPDSQSDVRVAHNSGAVAPNSVVKTVIKPQQGHLMDVILTRERVPIDYWIFQKIGQSGSIDDRAVVYMTDLQDSTFSNQNARRLIHEILTRGRCGTPNDDDCPSLCLYTIPKICSDRRVFINWIFNHSWFTSARSKRYRMYNLYKKYFPLPLEVDDYDAPLLEDSRPYSTDNPVEVSKSDIQAENYLDVPETTKVICSDQLFVEQDPDFSLYCNGDYLQWNGERSDSYQPVVARYYMVVVTDPEPVFSYTGDGLVTVTDETHPSGDTSRFEYTGDGNTERKATPAKRVERLSHLIKVDPLISWRRVNNRVDQKLSKLGELMILEHRQESMVDGIQKLLNRSHIDMYQTFGIDVVIRDGEPYIFRIEASPVFNEIGSPVAHDMLESLVERTKLMLRL